MNRILQTALAALLVCGAVACAMGPRKTEAQRLADTAAVDRVQAALSADQVLYARHITIRADNVVVTLGGYVWTPEELIEARRDAQSVPGVAKVVDRIEIDRGAISDSPVTR
jgi:osmotically-inducible protein OsmY